MIRAACMFAIRSAFVRPEQRHAIMLFELRGVGVTYLEDRGFRKAVYAHVRVTRPRSQTAKPPSRPRHSAQCLLPPLLASLFRLHHFFYVFFHHPIGSSMASTADIWSLLSTVFNVCFSFVNRAVHSLKVECLVALVNTRGIPTLSCRLHTRMAPYYRQAHSTRQFYPSPGIWNKLTIGQFRL